jgi:hypothetical protein
MTSASCRIRRPLRYRMVHPPRFEFGPVWARRLPQEQVEQNGSYDRGDKREQDHQETSWPAAQRSDPYSSRPHGGGSCFVELTDHPGAAAGTMASPSGFSWPGRPPAGLLDLAPARGAVAGAVGHPGHGLLGPGGGTGGPAELCVHAQSSLWSGGPVAPRRHRAHDEARRDIWLQGNAGRGYGPVGHRQISRRTTGNPSGPPQTSGPRTAGGLALPADALAARGAESGWFVAMVAG